jgi:DNA sulfur modification protein DndD
MTASTHCCRTNGTISSRVSFLWGFRSCFFFDAEKIRFLADDDTDTATLGVAIRSLLGLDLAERLIADAGIVERRLSDSVLDPQADEQFQLLEQQLVATSKELGDALTEQASLENHLQRARSQLTTVEADFAAAGGEHWSQRTEIETRHRLSQSQLAETEEEIRALCAGELPLLLVRDLVTRAAAQDNAERQAGHAAAFNTTLIERDRNVVKGFRAAGQKPASVQALKKLLDRDRKQRLRVAKVKPRLDLSGHAGRVLRDLDSDELDTLQRSAGKLLRRAGKTQTEREKCRQLLNATPDDTTIAAQLERLREAAAIHGKLEGEARRLADRVSTLRRERDELDRRLTDLRRMRVDREIKQEESLRMVQLAQRTQSTMREFLRRATAYKIDRLSHLITESFRFLLRKETLVSRVQIHPETYRIDLFDATDQPLQKGRLSEGEKQIFAIAVLWGLAKAAPRPLPAIIDTPMARLDSQHRQHLVERYFPNASHQVVILSTDTEIERGYFEHLRPHITRSFHLRYDEDQRATISEPGFFWKHAAEPIAESSS